MTRLGDFPNEENETIETQRRAILLEVNDLPKVKQSHYFIISLNKNV